jgi:hypothetical protein
MFKAWASKYKHSTMLMKNKSGKISLWDLKVRFIQEKCRAYMGTVTIAVQLFLGSKNSVRKI